MKALCALYSLRDNAYSMLVWVIVTGKATEARAGGYPYYKI